MGHLVDNCGDDCKRGFFNRGINPLNERGAGLGVDEDSKIAMLLSDFVAVQNDRVVAPKLELEALDARHHDIDEIGLLENTECQRKYWKMAVDRLQAMVAAFIDIDDIIAVKHAAFYHAGTQSTTG